MKQIRYFHSVIVLGSAVLLVACKQSNTVEVAPPRPLSDGSYAVVAETPRANWREYVPGSRATQEAAVKQQLLAGLSGLELETMRKSIADLNVVATPNPEHARLFSILMSIRQDEAMAKSLADSRKAAEVYWPVLGVVVAPELLPTGVTARLVRRLNHDPTNVVLISPSGTVAADLAVALTELRRLRTRDGDVLFASDMEAVFDVSAATRSSAQYVDYPQNVLDALLSRAPKAPVSAVQGIGDYPVDLFRVRSLSGKRPKMSK